MRKIIFAMTSAAACIISIPGVASAVQPHVQPKTGIVTGFAYHDIDSNTDPGDGPDGVWSPGRDKRAEHVFRVRLYTLHGKLIKTSKTGPLGRYRMTVPNARRVYAVLVTRGTGEVRTCGSDFVGGFRPGTTQFGDHVAVWRQLKVYCHPDSAAP